MTLDEYNKAVQQIVADQQEIAQSVAKLAMTAQANPMNSEFGQLMTRQWALMQQMGKLNTELMMGIFTPRQ